MARLCQNELYILHAVCRWVNAVRETWRTCAIVVKNCELHIGLMVPGNMH